MESSASEYIISDDNIVIKLITDIESDSKTLKETTPLINDTNLSIKTQALRSSESNRFFNNYRDLCIANLNCNIEDIRNRIHEFCTSFLNFKGVCCRISLNKTAMGKLNLVTTDCIVKLNKILSLCRDILIHTINQRYNGDSIDFESTLVAYSIIINMVETFHMPPWSVEFFKKEKDNISMLQTKV